MRVTPRRIVAIIDKTFPWAENRPPSHDGTVRGGQSAELGMLVSLTRSLPTELLPQDPDDFIALMAAVSAIEAVRQQWSGLAGSALDADPLRVLSAFGNRAAVQVIRDVLVKCPEEGIRVDTAGLEFVADLEFRDSLRRDLSSTKSMLERGEYKGATVIGGSVLESLLLDAVSIISASDRSLALTDWRGRSKRPGERAPKDLAPEIDRWTLEQLIWIARCANLISEETAAFADVVRDFRNLIHPGKRRLHVAADEGTAHAALGAVLRVASELEKRAAK